MIQHDGLGGYLSPSDDHQLDADHLPTGHLPVWIQRTGQVTDVQVLERVKSDYLLGDNTVTVLYYYNNRNDETAAWCEAQGKVGPDQSGRNKWRYVNMVEMRGSEDKYIVVMDRISYEHISRGRNRMVLVTTRGG